MKLKLSFNVEAWIEDLEIEADSIEEAKEKLMYMNLRQLVEEDYVEKSVEYTEIESEIAEAVYEIKVSNVKYNPGSLDDDTEFTKEEVEAQYPDGSIIEVESDEEPDIFEVSDYLVDNSQYLLWGDFDCDYEIIKVK